MGILKNFFRPAEWLFAVSGFLMIVSAVVVYQTHDFTLWNIVNVFYGIATILFIKYA